MSDELPATGDGEFAGFAPLEGNFLYCPNQFFEVCLRNHSRGAVRLVGYLLLKTLGWLDGKGLPVEQQIRVTYRELIAHAGISRGALSGAIDEAIIAKFIERVATSPAATFALRWDSGDAYQMDSRTFAGIYAGEGYRSPIPLAYFSQILPQEPLSVAEGRLPADIEQQIQWLPLRKPSQNPLGLLRRAIEENWSAPAEVQGARIQAAARQREDQSLSEQQVLEQQRAARKRQTEQRRAALLGFWNGISVSQEARYRQQAIGQAASDLDRRRLQRSTRDQPEIEILEAMARDLSLPTS